jgi:hypothetical protein
VDFNATGDKESTSEGDHRPAHDFIQDSGNDPPMGYVFPTHVVLVQGDIGPQGCTKGVEGHIETQWIAVTATKAAGAFRFGKKNPLGVACHNQRSLPYHYSTPQRWAREFIIPFQGTF